MKLFLKFPKGEHMKTLIFTLLAFAFTSQVALASGFSDCYSEAKREYDSKIQAVDACSTAGAGFSYCHRVAKRVFNSDREAIAACKTAGAGFVDCFQITNREMDSKVAAINACGSVR